MITQCPVCASTSLTERRIVDHFLSQETFKVLFCSTCEHGVTAFESSKSIDSYYDSKEYLSHSDQSAGLISLLYRKSRTLMLQRKFGIINDLKSDPGVLLDYGCGTGTFINYMKHKGWGVSGYEPSATAREFAKTNSGKNIFSETSEINGRFDVITLWHVLEHTSDPKEVMKRLGSLIVKEGALIIAVPNHKSFDASHYKTDWAAYDVPRHLQHFSKKSIQSLSKETGWSVVAEHPMKLDAYYISLLSEKYRNKSLGIFRYFKAFLIATISNFKATHTGEFSSNIFILKKC